jgi:MYXO-CTERM domain-containing protein
MAMSHTPKRSLSCVAGALALLAPAAALAQTAKVDVLFVIDNSGSMQEEQAALVQNFPAFMTALENGMGGLPDIHIGVISSNAGAGQFNLPGCASDDGALQAAARVAGCTPPQGAFISDEIGPGGVRVKNYTGSLADTFACIAPLGTAGCGFEQHLESTRLALNGSNPGNAGFLRPDAYLAIVIVADEDDCSAADVSMYDPAQMSISDPLGPLTSFRCAEFGITCAQGDLARGPGSYTDCQPRSGSYVRHPQDYVDFLKGLKADPERVIVATIVGNPEPVAVDVDFDGRPGLQPSCTSAAGNAFPSVRFAYVASQFPGRHVFHSICNPDLTPALASVADMVSGAVSGQLPDAGPLPPDAAVGVPDAAPAEPDAAIGEDAGVIDHPDAGGGDNGGNGNGNGNGDDGCGCRAGDRPGTSPSGALALALAATLGAVLLRRRRAR